MNKILKSNKFLIFMLIFVCIIFICNPMLCSNSTLNAVSVWATKVFPMLFPLFVLTRLLLNLITIKPNFLDKFLNKLFHTPCGTAVVYFLSILSGYPMGAKLISSLYENKTITTEQAKKMLSICSVSGPMFMIGTVGVAFFSSFKIGLIIFVSNLLASFLNGFIHRGKNVSMQEVLYAKSDKKTSLGDCVYDSIISILMVGGYIILSFLLVDLLQFFLPSIDPTLNTIFAGMIEITRGINDLSLTSISIFAKTIISSTLVAFGGVSILLQSLSFVSKINIKPKTILFQKITQSILCFFISFIFCLIFL